jgi:hypothetical protein
MLDQHLYEGFSDCVAQIERDFGADFAINATQPVLFFRGENSVYEKTESSMKRFLTEEDGLTMRPFDYASPFIDFEDEYAEHHASEHGLTEEEGKGFVQHYGFTTDLFDITPSIEMARFFANYLNSEAPIGMIGVFPREDLEQHFVVTDLSKHPVAQRPRNQVAYSARPISRILDLKAPYCDEHLHCRWYKFRKSKEDLAFAMGRKTLAYPTEDEISNLFGLDFDRYFRGHWAYGRMDQRTRELVDGILERVRRNLR